jgi:hypothetical protein
MLRLFSGVTAAAAGDAAADPWQEHCTEIECIHRCFSSCEFDRCFLLLAAVLACSCSPAGLLMMRSGWLQAQAATTLR